MGGGPGPGAGDLVGQGGGLSFDSVTLAIAGFVQGSEKICI